MTDIKLPASGNIRMWFGLENSLANYLAPTATEINAMLDISDAISWNDFGFGMSASNTINDPAITAIGKASNLGAMQFGGAISFYYPQSFTDTSNKYQVVYDAFDQTRTKGYIVMRVDGTQSTTAAVAADTVFVFKVMNDAFTEVIVGEEAFRYTVKFLPQGVVAPRAIVKSASALATLVWAKGVLTPTLAASLAVKTYKLDAKVDGRWRSNGVTWSSSDTTKVTVSRSGVATVLASTGSVTITATYAGGGTAGASVLTLAI